MKGASIQEVYGHEFNVNSLSPFTIPFQSQPTQPEYETNTDPLSYTYAHINDGFEFSKLDDDYETIVPKTQSTALSPTSRTHSLSNESTSQMTPKDYLLNKVLNDEECYKKLESHFQTKLGDQLEKKINDKIEQFASNSLTLNTHTTPTDIVDLIQLLFQRIFDFILTTDIIANMFVILIVLFLFLIVIDLSKTVFSTSSNI